MSFSKKITALSLVIGLVYTLSSSFASAGSKNTDVDQTQEGVGGTMVTKDKAEK